MNAQITACFFGCCLAAIAAPPALPGAYLPSFAGWRTRKGKGALANNEDFGRGVRFFGPFNFMNPAPTGQSARDALLLSTLGFCPPHGMRCALGMIMLISPENMNTRKRSLPVVVTGVNFKTEVLESRRPVLVEFWAPWSRPCQVMDSVLQELASAWAGKVKVVKVNADDSLDLSLLYEIQLVPTLVYFVRGNPCLRILGTASKEAILAKIQPFSQ
jgi:thioredoxin